MAGAFPRQRGAGGAHACDLGICTIELTMRLCNTLLRKYFSYFNFPSIHRNNFAVGWRHGARNASHIQPLQSSSSVISAFRFPILLVVFSLFLPQLAKTTDADRVPIVEALGWVRSAPRDVAEFDYVMTARVRLLFFWAGKDDVGGGYIRMGVSKTDPRQELLQVLFGSDPAKAPRAINRWGAGTEVVWHKDPASHPAKTDDVTASAFFGFMKSSKGKSISEIQEELRKEKNGGEHQFTGILSRVESGRAISLVVPLASSEDYNLHQYAEAEPIMLEKLEHVGQSGAHPGQSARLPSRRRIPRRHHAIGRCRDRRRQSAAVAVLCVRRASRCANTRTPRAGSKVGCEGELLKRWDPNPELVRPASPGRFCFRQPNNR